MSYPSIVARVLPSGLLLLLESDSYASSAGVVSVVRGGSSSDPIGKEGLAHLVEHLTFRAVDATPGTPLPLASPGRGAEQRATRQERLIHYAVPLSNGLTSPDAITFLEFGSSSRLPWLLELEGARLTAPLAGVDAQVVAAERRVIANESQLRDDPRVGVWAGSHMFPLVFPSHHPYARGVNGFEESRPRLTLEDARAYVTSHFRPDRMTLLVTAPIASTNLDAIIDHLPAALVGDAQHPVPHSWEPDRTVAAEPAGGPILRRTSPLPAEELWIGWSLPGFYGGSGPVEAVLARWIQEDLDIDQLRLLDPHIRHIAVSLIPGQQAGAILLRVLLEKGAQAEHVTEVVSDRVSTLWTRASVDLPIIERLRATLETELLLDQAGQAVRAVEQAQMAALGSRPVLRADVWGAMRSLPTAGLTKFAREHLAKQRRRAVLFTPAGAPTVAGASGEGPAATVAHAAVSAYLTRAAAWDPLEMPGAIPPVSSVVMKKLESGLTLIVARRRATAVTAWLGFHGGYADAASPLIVELARRLRPDAIDAPKNGALSGRGASLDSTVETLVFQPGDLGPALSVLFAKATVSVKTWPERQALQRLAANVNADVDPVSEQAHQAFLSALFGDHPFARAVRTADSVAVARGDVDSWVARTRNLENAALVVVGDVDADEVALYANAVAAGLKAKSTGPTGGPVAALAPPRLRTAGDRLAAVITPGPGTLTAIRLGCLLPPMTAAQRADYEVLRLTVQERLGTALRFELGEGYALAASHGWLRGGTSYLDVLTFVDVGALPQTLAALRQHWRRWGATGFEPGEVNVARWLYAGELAMAYQGGDAIAYHLFNDWNADPAVLGQDTFRNDPVTVTEGRLRQLFSVCKANGVLGLTGPRNALRRALTDSWPEAR